ncbi:MAG: DUF1345 domain-containing protein [Burkholderiaceae bacterium]
MSRRRTNLITSRPWLMLSALAGVLAGVASPSAWPLVSRVLLGWNIANWLYLGCLVVLMSRADAQGVRYRARRLDDSGWVDLALAAIGPVMSLAAVVFELLLSGPHGRPLGVALTVSTIIGAWLGNALIFGMHYANLYYRRPDPPALRFPDDALEPDYWDFLYFSFTIAIAQQTADVAIASRTMRRTVLAQALLSYLFNLAILALSINIASNLLAGG